MKWDFKLHKLVLVLLVSTGSYSTLSSASNTAGVNIKAKEEATIKKEQEALAIGTEAYIYGYPLVAMELTRKVMTNVAAPQGLRAPMGQFAHERTFANASVKETSAPNVDALSSLAWIDISKEPYILHLPDESDRFYMMSVLSAWTNVIADLGTLTTGTKAQDFVIVGPAWHGSLPKEMNEIKSPTNIVWLVGKTYCSGTQEDYQTVHAIQNQYQLIPLSAYGKSYSLSKGNVDSNIAMTIPIRDQVNQMNAESFFNQLALLMKTNPPTAEDAPLVAQLSQIGVVPGEDFRMKKLDKAVAKGLEQAVKVAQEKIMSQANYGNIRKNGWTYSLKTGQYGTDYLQRAFIANTNLGANKPNDVIDPVTLVDNGGQSLNGANRYLMHFPKELLPPVNAFWSLTIYDRQYYFPVNSLNRYTLSPRDALQYNPDGSLNLYIQKESPGKDKESNWLPAPEGEFILMLRLYWPKASALDASWSPPLVLKLE